MRGKAARRGVILSYIGITPAYAGKSKRFADALNHPRDHPRICGEKTKKIP